MSKMKYDRHIFKVCFQESVSTAPDAISGKSQLSTLAINSRKKERKSRKSRFSGRTRMRIPAAGTIMRL
jgi:hypothetical protein